MQSKCPFCDKTYGDAEEHHCVEWAKDITEKAEESRKNLERIFKECMNGKFVPSKDDN